MLINLALNYIIIAITTILQSLKNTVDITIYNFKLSYLFNPPGAFNNLITLLFAAMLSMLYGYKLSTRIQQKLFPESDLEGSNHWADNKEIKNDLTCVSQKVFKNTESLDTAADGGYVIAMDKQNCYIDKGDTHTLCTGAARSGKTQRIILNTLRSMIMARNSLIVNDVKGELCENLYAQLKACNYKILFFNVRDPKRSHGWNALGQIIKEYLKAKETDNDLSYTSELISDLAYVITENKKSDPIWPSAAKSLLEAIIMYMLDEGYEKKCLDKLNMYSVKIFFLEYGTKTIAKKVDKKTLDAFALDEIFDKLPVGNWSKTAYATSEFSKGEMRASIFSTLSDDLQIFTNMNIAKLTSKNDIDFSDLYDSEQPCAIFLITPDEKSTFHKLTTLFITQSYAALIAAAYKYPKQRLPRNIKYIIDEFGLLPAVPDIGVKASGCLSRGVGLLFCIQDIPQIEEKYGVKVVDNIINNCHNKIYVLTQEPKTNKYFSDMLAKGTVNYATYSGGNGDILDTRRSTHLKARELKTADELSRLNPGEIIVLRQRMHPIFTHISAYYELNIPLTPIANMGIPEINTSMSDILYPMRSVDEIFDKLQKESNKTDSLIAKSDDKETIAEPAEEKNKPKFKDQNSALKSIIAICDKLTDGNYSALIKAKNSVSLLQFTEDLLNSGDIGGNEYIMLNDYISNFII